MPGLGPEPFTAAVANGCGLAEQDIRCYTSACVAASTAIGDAASIIARGHADRVVVAGGYLVESDQFALFDGPPTQLASPFRKQTSDVNPLQLMLPLNTKKVLSGPAPRNVTLL